MAPKRKKQSSAPVGRPPKMTDLVIKKLEEAFLDGATDEEACFYADISHQTLYNYQKEHPEFVERKEALKQNPIFLARRTVVRAVKIDPEIALKFLERKKKDEFSTRSEVTGKDGKDLFGLESMTEEELDEEIARTEDEIEP